MVAGDPCEQRISEVLSQSPIMAQILNKVARVAKTDAQVLVLGETGVGKGLLAHAMHKKSSRRQQAFIAVNCAALSPSLIESELFGHERGAFTSAVTRHIGYFEQAHGGTLFLDEIGDLPLASQRVLLHILEANHLRRVGGGAAIPINVRIMAATNRDLYQAVQERTFRADLYQRLKVFPVVLPPLRERREDIPLLAAHFVRQYARKHKRPVRTVSDEALAHLQGYAWPGNVRELIHWVERMVILCEGERLERADVLEAEAMEQALASWSVTPETEHPEQKQPLDEDEEEKQRIIAALEKTNWVVSGKRGAHRLLGMSHQTLRYRMDKYGIQRPKPSSQMHTFKLNNKRYLGSRPLCTRE